MDPRSPELTVYYDKRYKQFFFAGAHHPNRGPATTPTVHVVSQTSPTDRQPILLSPDEKRQRRPKAARVNWAEDVQSQSGRSRRCDTCTSVAVCIALFLATGLGLIIAIPLMLFTKDPTPAGDDDATTATVEESMSGYVPPSYRERWTTVGTDYVSTPEPFGISMPAGNQSYNKVAAQHAAALDWHGTGKKTIVNVCLLDNAITLSGTATEESLWNRSRVSSCNLVVECRYYVDKEEMRLRTNFRSIIGTHRHRFRRVERGSANESRVSMLLCVSIDDEVLQNVAADNARHLTTLVQDVAMELRVAEYDGICLRFFAAPTEGRGNFLSVIYAIADRLSGSNYSLSVLLPYGLPGRMHSHEITRLVAVLGRPHAVLFYPTAALFRNKTKWPSPKEIAFLPLKASANVCYLLPAGAQAVALQGTCDVHTVQRIKNIYVLKTALEGCRLWNRSWTALSDAYNTYACNANAGILFQTSKQAMRYREDVVRYAHATCIGDSDTEFDSFPAMCR